MLLGKFEIVEGGWGHECSAKGFDVVRFKYGNQCPWCGMLRETPKPPTLEPADAGKWHGPDDDPEEAEYRKYKRFQDRYKLESMLESMLEHNKRVCELYTGALSAMRSYAGEPKPESWPTEHRDYWGHNCSDLGKRGWLIPYTSKQCATCGVERPRQISSWWSSDEYWEHNCRRKNGIGYLINRRSRWCDHCGVERPQARTGS